MYAAPPPPSLPAKRKADAPLPPPTAARPAAPAQPRPAAPPAAAAAAAAAQPSASSSTGGPVAMNPVSAMTTAVANAMKNNPPPTIYPVPEKPFSGNVLPLPANLKVQYPPKKTAADYTESISPFVPCPEMNNIAVSLSALTGKTIITDYWVESLSRDNKLMVVELLPNPGSAPPARRTFILMKNRQEFTSPISEYHEILYFVPGPVKDGKPTKSGACAYLFVTQNSIYMVKFPIKMGSITMADYEKMNREIDAAGY